jgi:hypothetical protein
VGTPEQPRRRRGLSWLAGFVVVFAGASWLLTGGVGRGLEPPTERSSPAPFSEPIPSECGHDQLQVGTLANCVAVDRSSVRSCRQGGGMFEGLFTLDGGGQQYRLYISLLSGYHGAGDYVVNSPAGAFIYVRDYATGALWQSVSGSLAVSGGGPPSGTLDAYLGFVGDGGSPSMPLTVAGSWRCV